MKHSAALIFASNAPVWLAIASIRIDRSPVTMSGLYDALNNRRNLRARWASDSPLVTAMRKTAAESIRSYGQCELTATEVYRRALARLVPQRF